MKHEEGARTTFAPGTGSWPDTGGLGLWYHG